MTSPQPSRRPDSDEDRRPSRAARSRTGRRSHRADRHLARARWRRSCMVVDEPVRRGDCSAQVVERPRGRGRWRRCGSSPTEYTAQGRGFELREVAGGWRFYTRAEYAAVRGALRPGRPAGPAHPGRAGDARGGGLPPAGQPGPRLRGARGERGRRRCARCSPGAWSRRPAPTGQRRAPVPDDDLLPGAAGPARRRRAARAGTVSA